MHGDIVRKKKAARLTSKEYLTILTIANMIVIAIFSTV